MQVSDGESATFPLGVHHYFGHAGENLFTADNVYSDGEEDSYGVLVEKLWCATAEIHTLTLH